VAEEISQGVKGVKEVKEVKTTAFEGMFSV
jgi:hypothetical protein